MAFPAVMTSFAAARFAVRTARHDDAAAIARVQVDSWRTSYRGILPDTLLAAMLPRVDARRAILQDATAYNLVAYDATHGDIVGFANASRSRRHGAQVGELYELYLVDRAKSYGLGRELFELVTEWCRAQQLPSMMVWVLEGNHHARRFYATMGGELTGRLTSTVRGFPVVELGYQYRL